MALIRAAVCFVLILGFACGGVRAQSLKNLLGGGSGAASEDKAQPSAAEQREWASQRLSEIQAREKALNVDELREEFRLANLPETRVDEYLSDLRETIRHYQLAVDTLSAVIKKESQGIDPALSEPVPPPKDDSGVDVLREKLGSLHAQAQTAATQVRLGEEFLSRQRAALKTAGQQLRRAQEEFDTASDDAARNRAALQLRLAEAQRDAAASAVFLGSWRLYADELDLRASQAQVRAIEQALTASGLDSVFSQKRAQAAIQRIENEKSTVQKETEFAQAALRELDETIAGIEQERQSASEVEDRKRIDRRLEIAREARDVANRIAVAAQARSVAIEESLRIWKTTLSVAQHPGPAAYTNARKQADQLLAQADPWREQIQRYLHDSRERLDELESQMASKDPAARKLEEQRLDILRRRVAQLREVWALFESVLGHAEQVRAESNRLLAQSSVSERLHQGATSLGERVASLWNYELFTAEEKIIGEDGSVLKRTRGISVGKILLAIIGLVAGLLIAKTLARIIKNNLGRRFAVDTARAAFLEKILYYFLLAIVVLTTLNWLRIPLTAFAFLGGAIAIGVGFGAQTLMNNFISGLILLAEQKIKVGDLIDVDGHLGRVINLGTRCSRVRKFDGVDVLVPNSYLLEKNVINWTLSDQHHRYDFIIGVSYGTPTDLVVSTLRSALDAQPEVLKEPAASVIFEAFGDNALTFHLYYWLDIGRSDANKVGSEIRLRIDRLCREAGIEIAFPQRDIHLHTAKPISVRLEGAEAGPQTK